MPLIQGKSDEARSKNIATEMKAGKPRKQSIAIAYSVQRKNKKKKMALGGAVESSIHSGHSYDREPAMPKDKPDNKRPNESDYMGDEWTAYKSGGEVLTEKPNSPRPSQASTESEALNERAPRGGSTHEQMAEYHEQEAAKHRMMSKGGMYNEGGIAEFEGKAQEDGYPGTPSPKEDNYRRPASAFIDTERWSDDEEPSRSAHYEGGGMIEDIMKKRKKMSDGGDVGPTLGGVIGYPGTPSSVKKAKGGSIQQADEAAEDMVANVMKRRKEKMMKMADGGEVDLEENSEEVSTKPGPYDDYDVEAADHPQYDDTQISEQPEDSNEHGDEEEKSAENEHDMISAIRRRMRSSRSMR